MTQPLDANRSARSPAPASAACFWLNVFALATALGAFAAATQLWPDDGLAAALAAAAVIALIIATGEALFLRERLGGAAGLASFAGAPRRVSDALLRTAGLLATLAVIGLAYWLLPEYHGSFYEPFWRFLRLIGPPALFLAPFYFYWIAGYEQGGEDAYLQLGRLLAWQGRLGFEAPTLRAHFMGWTVKAFFLPLMVVYLNREVGSVVQAWHALRPETMRVYQLLYELSFLIDLLFCVVGYTMTLRALGTHIRSTEPTVFGWLVALICYQPFYSVIELNYLKYESGLYWDNWLAAYPLLRALCAAAIIALVTIYALSTVAFGLRFSNLTHRGIITDGPYRWSKHPAYICKNLSWWLISMPFLSPHGWLESLRNCGLLLLLNLIYYWRAKSEERHLSRDPVYLAYSAWIADNGLLPRFRA